MLIEIWTLIGEPCGKYLAPIMADTLGQLEAFGELDQVSHRLTESVREQLTRNINRIQQALIASAKDKTLVLRDHVS